LLREIILRTIRYSLTCVGMRYTVLFSITLYVYLHMYRGVLILVVTLALSILMVIASTLSDRRNIVQFINVLNLVGGRRKVLFTAAAVFISLRSLFIAIVYGTAILQSFNLIPIVLFIHIIVVMILSLIVVRGGIL